MAPSPRTTRDEPHQCAHRITHHGENTGALAKGKRAPNSKHHGRARNQNDYKRRDAERDQVLNGRHGGKFLTFEDGHSGVVATNAGDRTTTART